jgi:hypothetical protein
MMHPHLGTWSGHNMSTPEHRKSIVHDLRSLPHFQVISSGVSVVLEIAVGIRVRKNKVTEKIEMKYLPNGLI